MTLKRSGFRKQSLEEIKEKQAVKRLKAVSKPRKAPKPRTSLKKGSKVAKQPKKGKSKTQAQKAKALRTKLWELCKEVVRKRDGNVCVICGKQNLTGSGWHTGHLIPRSTCGALLRYDIRNLHSSCYYCNINLGGNGAMYLMALTRIYGSDFVSNIFLDKEKYTKDDNLLLESKILEYEQIQSWSQTELFNYTKNYKTTQEL